MPATHNPLTPAVLFLSPRDFQALMVSIVPESQAVCLPGCCAMRRVVTGELMCCPALDVAW
jgi:hypothetical protein